MRYVRFILLPLVFVACTDTQPLAPDVDAAPSFRADRAGYTISYDLQDEEPFFVCRGELVEGYGILLIHITETTTPSGNLIVKGWVEYPDDVRMVGTVTGVVWTQKKGINPFVEVIKGDFYMQRFMIHEWYTNPDLGRLQARWWGGFKYDKDGELTIYREALLCE